MLNGSGENCSLLRLSRRGALVAVAKCRAVNSESQFGKRHYCLIAQKRFGHWFAIVERDGSSQATRRRKIG
jgi:hypothetical protein